MRRWDPARWRPLFVDEADLEDAKRSVTPKPAREAKPSA